MCWALMELEKLKCKECDRLFENVKSLINHLVKFHHISSKEYYDKFYKQENDGICKICKSATKFKNFIYGYREYCSNRCSRLDGDVYKKAKDTNIKKYGCSCTLANDKIKKKSHETKKQKYNDEYYCNSEKARQRHNLKTFEKFKNDITDCNIMGYNNKILTCECNICHNIFDIDESFAYLRHYRYNLPLCTGCYPKMQAVSSKELDMLAYIKSIYPNDIKQNVRNILENKELDIYLPDKKLAFEFDGLYWHSELYKDKNYHLNKTEACRKKGIRLIHVFEDEWKYKGDIVKSRICGLLGLNTRIFARKCDIREVNYNDSKAFLDMNHIQGNCMSTYRYGLYYNNELVSIMTFGPSRFADGEYELIRFCNKLNVNVIGGASKLFKYFLRNHAEYDHIVSYADRRWSVGNLYEKLGFELISETPPAYYYVKDDCRFNRIDFQKHKLVKAGFDSKKTEHEIMLERKIYRIYDCGNLKYCYTV